MYQKTRYSIITTYSFLQTRLTAVGERLVLGFLEGRLVGLLVVGNMTGEYEGVTVGVHVGEKLGDSVGVFETRFFDGDF